MRAVSGLYAAHPLLEGKRTIRVFDVDAPNPEKLTCPNIQGTLRVIDLDDSTKFSVLSYVGKSFCSPPDRVQCDGYLLNVPRDCVPALTQLQTTLGRITIWIDWVCINQDDEEEKGRHLEIMRAIYAAAENSYVWLGEEDEGLNEAIDYFSVAGFQKLFRSQRGIDYDIPNDAFWQAARIMATKNPMYLQSLIKDEEVTLDEALLQYTNGCLSMPDSCVRIESVDVLLSHVWSQTAWTQQDRLLASNPIICCGSRMLPWHSVVYSVAYLEHAAENYAVYISEYNLRAWRQLVLMWCLANSADPLAEKELDATTLRAFLPDYFDFLDKATMLRRVYLGLAVLPLLLYLFMTASWAYSRYWQYELLRWAELINVILSIASTVPIGLILFWTMLDPICRSFTRAVVLGRMPWRNNVDSTDFRGLAT